MRTHRAGPMTLAVACALMLPLAGCGEDQAAAPAATTSGGRLASGQMLADSGLSVTELLADVRGEPVVVRAYLLVDTGAGGSTRLCDALAESYPPQCGGDAIAVTGLPPELVDGLTGEAGAAGRSRWFS